MTPFEAFRKDPTPETLLTLLRAHQDGVYTVCLHILRNPHDAEDAAQEALLKIASGAKDLREPRAFKSWLYRLAYRTAVDQLRRRATRRRTEEGSASMRSAPLSDDQREAIHEAMAALPDNDRLILVEHYFEKTTIEELGRQEGISDVAMGKRLERAREKLKRGLAGAGILLGGSQVTHALESVSPAIAPPGLVGSAIASKAAFVAAGGAALGTKSGATVLVIVALFVALTAGGSFYLLSGGYARTPSSPPSTHRVESTPDPVGSPSTKTELKTKAPADVRTCRDLVVRLVLRLRSGDLDRLAQNVYLAHAGKLPLIESFLQDFIKAAGGDVVQVCRDLLAETESDAVKCLLAIVLGRAADPASLDLLKGLCGGESSTAVAASALYSIGLLHSPEGLSFLQATWERMKETGGPLGETLMRSIGLSGADGIDWLLSELRSSKLDRILSHQGSGNWSFHFDKFECLAFIRGKDAFESLRRVYETDPDPSFRLGAAGAMMASVESKDVDYLATVVAGFDDPGEQAGMIIGILRGPSSPARTELADCLLARLTFPSGHSALDEMLIRLSRSASPDRAGALFERYLALASQSKEPEQHWRMGAVFQAMAARDDAAVRLEALMEKLAFSPDQRGITFAMGLYGATPETASRLSKPVLAIIQNADPGSALFANCIQPLLLCGLEERILSTTLQELNDRQTDPADRLRILQELVTFTGGSINKSRAATVPMTFLAAAADQAQDPESLLCAVHAIASSDPDALSRWRAPITEWIGRDMKWSEASNGEQGLLSWVAPSLIGDYYARFGTADDTTWLKDLPDRFPYPSSWSDSERSRVKAALKDETRRAIDAIKLRN